ncbi:MAG: saccharopine dehydrogenase NADP-binding domain-containing protein, partial [Gemmatimonadota bacterium]|nr:saccharopine dehydrogenase NADP-binding domain-containing protein [Gemmatimonadota bacterium]
PPPDVQLTIAGRSLARAEAAAAALNATAAHPVRARSADVRDAAVRRALCEGATVVLAASSTTELAAEIVRDAVAAGADAVDTNLSMPLKHAALRAMTPDVVRARRTVITDGGFHPGLPGVMVRHAAELLPGVTDAHVGGSFNIDWRALEFSEASAAEFVDELRHMNPESFVERRWVRSWSRVRPFDFGGAIGRRQCAPWAMQEVRELPAAIPTLRNAGFFVAGFSPVIDYLVMPAAFAALWCAPRARATIGRGFLWALRRFSPRGGWAVLLLHATSDATGRTVTIRVSHDDGYALTAIPVVAAVEQLLDGARRPGVFTQAGFVEPASFLRRIEALGVRVDVQGQLPVALARPSPDLASP